MDVLALIGWSLLALAGIGAVYAIAASILVPSFLNRKSPSVMDAASAPPVTILKPLCGDEPGLVAHLATFCRQNYPGPIQVVCGVQSPDDPAATAVDELRRMFPDLDIALVRDEQGPGLNRKVANLVAMSRAAKHETLILADSDIAVDADYVARVVACLGEEGVGAVTCLYRGSAVGGIWSRLSAMAIDHHFLPGVVIGLRLGLATPCFGSTIAIRKATLERFGGFAAFADQLADDYEIGRAVRGLGYRVAIPPFVVAHSCAERGLKELLAHELRWARTVFMIDRPGYIGSGISHALPLGLIGAAMLGFTPGALVVLAGTVAARLWLTTRVDSAIGVGRRAWRLFVARDLLSFFIYIAAFFVRSVTWREQRIPVEPQRMVAPAKGH